MYDAQTERNKDANNLSIIEKYEKNQHRVLEHEEQ